MASLDALIQRNAGSLGTLADAEHYHEPVMIDADDTEALLAGLQRMILIRVVEEKIGGHGIAGRCECPMPHATVRSTGLGSRATPAWR